MWATGVLRHARRRYDFLLHSEMFLGIESLQALNAEAVAWQLLSKLNENRTRSFARQRLLHWTKSQITVSTIRLFYAHSLYTKKRRIRIVDGHTVIELDVCKENESNQKRVKV